ncbi:MAG: hypothetical protein OEX00_07970, partial [Gammaproteobacteria bacterium]|nr:hypothetical protein [Gammaproteobacteria bacterium]
MFTQSYRKKILIGLSCTLLMACSGGSSEEESPPSEQPTLSGVVSNAEGSLALRSPTLIERLFAYVGKDVVAASVGLTARAGVTVKLIEVDDSGTQVGDPLATAVTDVDGKYSIVKPDGFVEGPQFVVRAGTDMNYLDARVVYDDMDINPLSDYVSDNVVTRFGTLSSIPIGKIRMFHELHEEIAAQVDTTGVTTDSGFVANMEAARDKDEEAFAQINNLSAAEQVCGTVTEESSTLPIENVLVIAKRFDNWLTQARAWTKSDGTYCMNLAQGDYIVGAINATGTSFGASEWYHSVSNGVPLQSEAEKLTVTSAHVPATPLTVDFSLLDGGRVQGIVLNNVDKKPVPGVQIQLRDFDSWFPAAVKRTRDTGTYRINVRAGNYILSAVNRGLAPWGSAILGGGGAMVVDRDIAQKIVVTAGNTISRAFALKPGQLLKGTVLQNGVTAMPGVRIRVQANNGPFVRLRTNIDGKYRVWLPEGASYRVQSVGNDFTSVTFAGTPPVATLNFTGNFSKAFVRLIGDDLGNTPVSQGKIFLLSSSGGFVNQEVSNSDGTATLYIPTEASHMISVRIDHNNTFGSIIYNGGGNVTTQAAAELISMGTGNLGTDYNGGTRFDIVLPTAGLLTGKVTNFGTPFAQQGVAVFGATPVSIASNIYESTRSHVDGSYKISVKPGTYSVKVFGIECAGIQIT